MKSVSKRQLPCGLTDRRIDRSRRIAKFTSFEAPVTLKSCEYSYDTYLAVLRSSNSDLVMFVGFKS